MQDTQCKEMQSSKSRKASSEAPHRISPAAARSNRSSMTAAPEFESSAGINQLRKFPSPTSQKQNEPQSLYLNPLLEKKTSSRVTYLESQLRKLREELNKANDQLASSESCRKRAQQEAKEAKIQVFMLSSKFEESQRQLMMRSTAEDDCIHQLHKISLERDRAWQSELAALQKQQLIDMSAWSSATREIHKLKSEIEVLVVSEATQAKLLQTANLELQAFREEMVKKDCVIESLMIQIADGKGAEAKSQGRPTESQLQLETAEANTDKLQFPAEAKLQCDVLKVTESFNSIASDLYKPKARVNELEDIVKKRPQEKQLLSFDQVARTEYISFQSDSEQLSSLHESTETKYQKEQVNAKVQTQLDKMIITYSQRESELMEAKAEIAELKSKLLNKEMVLASISDMNKKLNDEIRAQVNQVEAEFSSKIPKAAIDVMDLKALVLEKDATVLKYLEENKQLKIEIGNKEVESIKIREAEITKAKEEMEAELTRVKVHSEQWRKAAETAAAILMAGNNGRDVQRAGSLDPQCSCDGRSLMQSSSSDEMGGHLLRSKNPNVLRVIGGLWKKV